jgi:hypothetical protein
MSVSVYVLRCLAALCLPANVYLQRVQAGVSVRVKGWQYSTLMRWAGTGGGRGIPFPGRVWTLHVRLWFAVRRFRPDPLWRRTQNGRHVPLALSVQGNSSFRSCQQYVQYCNHRPWPKRK